MSAPKVDVLALLDAYIAHGIPQERPDLQRARAAVAELIAKAELFGHLFEAWNRDDESVPAELQATTESDVIKAMYDMRAALARIGGAE